MTYHPTCSWWRSLREALQLAVMNWRIRRTELHGRDLYQQWVDR